MDKLKVGFLTYSIKDFDPGHAEIRGVYGTQNAVTQEIRIDAKLSKERRRETFLHEVLHAVWGQWIAVEGDVDEEVAVRALAMGLTTVFKDNPEIKKELF